MNEIYRAKPTEEYGVTMCGVCKAELLCDGCGDMPDVCPKCNVNVDWSDYGASEDTRGAR